MTQGFNEAYDLSEGEEEKRKLKLQKEKEKQKEESSQKKKTKKKKKKKFEDNEYVEGVVVHEKIEEKKKNADSGSDSLLKAKHETAEEGQGSSDGPPRNQKSKKD